MRNSSIEISNRQDSLVFDKAALRKILRSALSEAGRRGELSVAVVGDAEITELNRRFLGRDRTTDVLSFLYDSSEGRVEGELVINAELAIRQAEKRSHSAEDELFLYAVHGALHLLDYDDASAAERKRMHGRALEILAACGRDVKS